MSFEITSIGGVSNIIGGFGTFAAALPNGVWNTVTLDPSTAGKTVLVHVRNSSNPNTSRGAFVRRIDNAGNPIDTIFPQIIVGGQSTTATIVTVNNNAEIQVRQLGNGVSYIHAGTFK